MKSIFYTSIIFYAAVSVSSATAASFNKPTRLSLTQMDSVTAGTAADVFVNSTAYSDLFSFTSTFGTASAIHTKTDNPLLGSYVGIAGGNAGAVTVGGGASTNTSVIPTVDVPGTNIRSYAVNIHRKIGGIEINSSSIIKIGSFINPLPLN